MEIDKLKKLWLRLADEGVIDENVRPGVAHAWKLSLGLGLNPRGKYDIEKALSQEEYEKLLAKNKFLLDIAIPIMENIYKLMGESQFLVVLTDNEGYILKAVGDSLYRKRLTNQRRMKKICGRVIEVASIVFVFPLIPINPFK